MSGNFTSLIGNPDLLCHCNVFISLFSASGFPSFKEHFKEHLSSITSNIAYTIGKAILRNLHYVQCLNVFQMERHAIWPQWKRHYGPNEICHVS